MNRDSRVCSHCVSASHICVLEKRIRFLRFPNVVCRFFCRYRIMQCNKRELFCILLRPTPHGVGGLKYIQRAISLASARPTPHGVGGAKCFMCLLSVLSLPAGAECLTVAECEVSDGLQVLFVRLLLSGSVFRFCITGHWRHLVLRQCHGCFCSARIFLQFYQLPSPFARWDYPRTFFKILPPAEFA